MRMRILLGFILSAAVVAPAFAAGSHSVRGYTRKDGTYVAPHHATNPDSSRSNNWSSRGNVNPYTGKIGTVDPYKTPSSTYSNPYETTPAPTTSSPY